VQHPYELAAFLLGPEADEEKLQRLRFSMGLDETDATEDDDTPKHGPESMLRSLSVSPRVPLFITYYTLFQVPGGMLQTFPDVYGYDRALAAALKTYLQ
jgi:murein L,D-transpeptidase YcbB/YkuD